MKKKLIAFFNLAYKYLQKVFYIDLRSLVLFRVSLGLFIIFDLLDRSRSLTVFYTDEGVIPRSFIMDQVNRELHFSIFHIAGSPFLVGILFVLYGLCAVALIVGFKTRLFTFLCWFFCMSLMNRAQVISFAAGSIQQWLLFWAMFLPLGIHYSVDSALNKHKEKGKHIVTFGSFAIIVQIMIIYIFAGLNKSHPVWWPEGSALAYALQMDPLITSIGIMLRNLPAWILTAATFGTVFLERFLPYVLLIPAYTGFFRLCCICAFWTFHFGILLAMHVMDLSIISMIGWTLIFPTVFWDKLESLFHCTKKGDGLKIYCFHHSSFSHQLLCILQEFLGLSKTQLILSEKNFIGNATLEAGNLWAVQDEKKQIHTAFPAFWILIQHSFLRKVIGAFNIVKICIKRLYNFAAYKMKKSWDRPLFVLQFTNKPYRPMKSTKWVVSFLITYILIYNYWGLDQFVHPRFRISKVMYPISDIIRLDQRWFLIAPRPSPYSSWFIIDGVASNGQEINIWGTSESKPKNVFQTYKSIRWGRYLRSVQVPGRSNYYPYFAQYLCKEYNQKQTSKEHWVYNLNFRFAFHETSIDGTQNPIRIKELYTHNCKGVVPMKTLDKQKI